MTKPIKPEDVIKTGPKIPDFIIDSVNSLIRKKWDGHEAKIYQNEILDMVSIRERDPEYPSDLPTRKEVFDNHWLDFEDLYRKQGWNVYYDKPGYCETYEAYFVFSKKK